MIKADPADFSPPLLRIQEQPPAPLAGWMLRLLLALLAGIALWTVFGQLDIVAVTDGKLVPSTYLKIVQPSEQDIVKEILVREGEAVSPTSSASESRRSRTCACRNSPSAPTRR